MARETLRGAMLFLGILSISWMSGALVVAADSDKDQQVASTLAEGRLVYLQACATCHGAYGDGNGAGAAGFAQPATDFTKGVYKFRTTVSEYITEAELARSIREGMSGTEMVPFKRTLTGRSIANVAAYLKSLSDKYDDPDATPSDDERLKLPAERPFAPSEESVAAGEEVFADSCADCHGEKGEGTTDETDEWDRPVFMVDFRLGYFKSGTQDTDLYRSIATGMPGTTMPEYHEDLEAGQIWHVVDFLRSLDRIRSQGWIGKLLGAILVDRPSGFDYRGE